MCVRVYMCFYCVCPHEILNSMQHIIVYWYSIFWPSYYYIYKKTCLRLFAWELPDSYIRKLTPQNCPQNATCQYWKTDRVRSILGNTSVIEPAYKLHHHQQLKDCTMGSNIQANDLVDQSQSLWSTSWWHIDAFLARSTSGCMQSPLHCFICVIALFCLAPFFCRDNILVLDVFFEALNYETIEQKKAYEVAGLLGRSDLIIMVLIALPNYFTSPFLHLSHSVSLSTTGDIGGQMGLFIGASILTILELFDYAYEVSSVFF